MLLIKFTVYAHWITTTQRFERFYCCTEHPGTIVGVPAFCKLYLLWVRERTKILSGLKLDANLCNDDAFVPTGKYCRGKNRSCPSQHIADWNLRERFQKRLPSFRSSQQPWLRLLLFTLWVSPTYSCVGLMQEGMLLIGSYVLTS